MKLLLFAHTPPPHHGQSFMVSLLLRGFGGDRRKTLPKPIPSETEKTEPIACYHVNCRYSDNMEEIGTIHPGKILNLLRYALEALFCRFHANVRTFYYIPAPGKRSALYRDWLVLLLCRWAFPRLIFHWHASGLSEWLETRAHPWERRLTCWLLGRPTLSIALAQASSRDAHWFQSQTTVIIPNGIPDPCPDFETRLLPQRKARLEERLNALPFPESSDSPYAPPPPPVFRILYLAHCTREKGLFDTLEAVALFNRSTTYPGLQAAPHSSPRPWRTHLTVAGSFFDSAEERAFHERIAMLDLASSVTYAGFVSGAQKTALLETSDALCFPTYYHAESFPVALVEAAAFGLPAVVTRWRAIPEIQPPEWPGYVQAKAPGEITAALEHLATTDLFTPLRTRFISTFSEARHLEAMTEALLSVEKMP